MEKDMPLQEAVQHEPLPQIRVQLLLDCWVQALSRQQH